MDREPTRYLYFLEAVYFAQHGEEGFGPIVTPGYKDWGIKGLKSVEGV